MSTLPTRRDPPEVHDVEDTPTWRELRDRIRDILKDVLREGRELERDIEPRLLPALKRLKAELERLIAKVEERAGAGKPRPPQP